MMNLLTLLPTEIVTFSIFKSTGEINSFGEPVVTTETHDVSGCIVQPNTTQEIIPQMSTSDIERVYIHIPSTFTKDLHAANATIRGSEYVITSSPVRLTRSPLMWDRMVICERLQ